MAATSDRAATPITQRSTRGSKPPSISGSAALAGDSGDIGPPLGQVAVALEAPRVVGFPDRATAEVRPLDRDHEVAEGLARLRPQRQEPHQLAARLVRLQGPPAALGKAADRRQEEDVDGVA